MGNNSQDVWRKPGPERHLIDTSRQSKAVMEASICGGITPAQGVVDIRIIHFLKLNNRHLITFTQAFRKHHKISSSPLVTSCKGGPLFLCGHRLFDPVVVPTVPGVTVTVPMAEALREGELSVALLPGLLTQFVPVVLDVRLLL